MRNHRKAAWIAAVVLTSSTSRADEVALTLEAALARARQQNPAVQAARARIAEARGRLRGASLLRDNPTLEAAAGRRAVEGSPADLDVGLSQTFELGGRRAARIDVARAAVAREEAMAEDGVRRAQRDVAAAFFRSLHAEERLRLAQRAEVYAAEIHSIAERRHARGDIAALDVNVALSARSRARSERRAAEAEQVAALGDLRVLLDIPPEAGLSLAGGLAAGAPHELTQLDKRLWERPDLKALEAELREAEAEIRVGQASGWPDVSPGIRYERDGGDRVLWGGLTVTLPVLNRGQEVRAVGEARASRLRAEIEALRRAIRSETSAALSTYRLRVQAAHELQATVGALDDNEALARRSYEVGQIGLGELLLVRRETLETRTALLDRLLEAAQARAELEARAGLRR